MISRLSTVLMLAVCAGRSVVSKSAEIMTEERKLVRSLQRDLPDHFKMNRGAGIRSQGRVRQVASATITPIEMPAASPVGVPFSVQAPVNFFNPPARDPQQQPAAFRPQAGSVPYPGNTIKPAYVHPSSPINIVGTRMPGSPTRAPLGVQAPVTYYDPPARDPQQQPAASRPQAGSVPYPGNTIKPAYVYQPPSTPSPVSPVIIVGTPMPAGPMVVPFPVQAPINFFNPPARDPQQQPAAFRPQAGSVPYPGNTIKPAYVHPSSPINIVGTRMPGSPTRAPLGVQAPVTYYDPPARDPQQQPAASRPQAGSVPYPGNTIKPAYVYQPPSPGRRSLMDRPAAPIHK